MAASLASSLLFQVRGPGGHHLDDAAAGEAAAGHQQPHARGRPAHGLRRHLRAPLRVHRAPQQPRLRHIRHREAAAAGHEDQHQVHLHRPTPRRRRPQRPHGRAAGKQASNSGSFQFS